MSLDHTCVTVDSVIGHEESIRRIFRDTLLMGQTLDCSIDNFDAYESMCLDWYLTTGAVDSGIVKDTQSGHIVGYVLVCVQPDSYDKWIRESAKKLFRRNVMLLLRGKMTRNSRQFYRYRMADAITITRKRRTLSVSGLPHVHLNIVQEARSGAMALEMLSFADAVCRRAGFVEWVGEMNAIDGRRTRAVERVVGKIVDVVPNRTASHFLQQSVSRLTIVRHIPPKA